MQHTIAVDLAKTVFQVAESLRPGVVERSRRLSRSQFGRYLANMAPSQMIFEACGSAHHWARQAQAHGHAVILLPPHRTRRYRTTNKTDATDTKALLEAARNEAILPVPIKSTEQQCLTAMHRLRSGYQTTRTARLNAIRGLLREQGVFIAKGAHHVVPCVRALSSKEIPEPLLSLLQEAADEVQDLQRRVQAMTRQLEALGKTLPAVQHLLTVPGIGIITATALVSSIGDVRRFPSSRHFASYLGLVSREHSTGARRHLGAITKQGDPYLRYLLIHGARGVLRWARVAQNPTPLQQWALNTQHRRGSNIATVALANKLARIAWRVWREERSFQPSH